MRLLFTTLLFFAFTLSAIAQDGFETNWQFVGEDRPAWFGTGTERNIAYGVVNGNERLFVASRSGGAMTIRVLDPNTGLEVPGVTISTNNIADGTIPFNTIDVSDDGQIIVTNLSVNTSAGDPFKVYLWEDEDAEPENIILYTTGGYRLADNISIHGSVSAGTAAIYAATGTTPNVLRWGMTENPPGSGEYEWDTDPTIYADLQNMVNWGTPAWVVAKETGAASPFLAGGRSVTYIREYTAAGTTTGFIQWGAGTYNQNVGSGEYFTHDGVEYIAAYHPTLRRAAIVVMNDNPDGTFSNKYDHHYGQTPVHGATTENTLGDLSVRDNGDDSFTLFVLATSNGIASYTTSEPPLPVELASFEARANGRDVVLNWATVSERNNAGFEVQKFSGDAFAKIGYVEGVGNSDAVQNYTFHARDLSPGSHTFRLKQVDFDGSFSYSPTVEVAVELAEEFVLTSAYPNPFNPSTSFALTIAREQHVSVEVFDMLGRRVSVLHDGLMPANDTQTFTFDAAELPSGVYLYRAAGETFSQTQRMTLVK